MRISPTAIDGVVVVELDKIGDDRGFFARAWDAQEMAAAGVETTIAQMNVSRTALAGTVRGLHLQREPHAEDKLIRCTRGALWDVAVDLRAGSPTRGHHVGVELDADSHRALFVPKGCAHGFQTLTDDTEVFYLVSARYAPDHEAGVRFDDPALAIAWPLPVTVVSDKDRSWPDLDLGPGT